MYSIVSSSSYGDGFLGKTPPHPRKEMFSKEDIWERSRSAQKAPERIFLMRWQKKPARIQTLFTSCCFFKEHRKCTLSGRKQGFRNTLAHASKWDKPISMIVNIMYGNTRLAGKTDGFRNRKTCLSQLIYIHFTHSNAGKTHTCGQWHGVDGLKTCLLWVMIMFTTNISISV